MATTRRKPPTKRATRPRRMQPAPAEAHADKREDGEAYDLSRWVQSLPPPPTADATALAAIIRARSDVRDVRFEPMRGVVLMYGYSGLSRVLNSCDYIHIATVDELVTMDDQQIYDAVQKAGSKH